VILAGLRPCSFIDYPGRLAAVVFTHGCNLRCRYCHNPGLVAGPPPRRVEAGEVLSLLAARRGRLDGLVVTGGEPTLHPRLPRFLAAVKEQGFLVKLDTNGTGPAALALLLRQGLVDFVAIDLKAAPEAATDLCGSAEQPAAARRCLDLVLAAGVEHEVRTTVAAPLHTPAHLASLAALAAGARRWCLQRFRPGGHLDPEAELRPPPPELLLAAQEEAGRRGLAVVVR
jgi:pyruvate formate lyase activating enzyme